MNSTPHPLMTEQHLDEQIRRFLGLRAADVRALPTADDSVRALTVRLGQAPRTTWRPRTDHWATALVAVVAFVALGTGAFFLAVRGPAQAPSGAAATHSPTPSLVTQAVEPGVVRVLSDGADHDLTAAKVEGISVGPEGATWMLGQSGLFRLGERATFSSFISPEEAGGSRPSEVGPGMRRNSDARLGVGTDGTVWVIVRSHLLESFDGHAWIDHPTWAPDGELWAGGGALGFALSPDGDVWASWETGVWDEAQLGKFDGGAWTFLELSGWPSGVSLGQVYGTDFAVTPDGSLWAAHQGPDDEPEDLLRFDGETWDGVESPFPVSGLAAGLDGSVWVTDGAWGLDAAPLRVARYEGQSWTEFTAPSDIRPGLRYWDENYLAPTVASDGSVWLRTMDAGTTGASTEKSFSGDLCDGLARFDGTAWSTYLDDTCVIDIAPGPDGSVWVATWHPYEGGPVYLIRPGGTEEAP